ncbi:MAG TPA: alkaline phosphatase family protein [Candidatus Binatia bacterium]|jgi:phospholipase C
MPKSVEREAVQRFDSVSRIIGGDLSRRELLSGAARVLGGAAFGTLLASSRAVAVGPITPGLSLPDGLLTIWPSTNKLKHIIILCQENRSFDHYYGSFGASALGSPGNRPVVFDPDRTYADSAGARYQPFHLERFCDFDPDHGWSGSHAKWNGGAMDGWIVGEAGESPLALGYYDAADHIYHVQLAQSFTIADHYFCSQIGPTLPNRLYLWSGTSGFGQLAPADDSALPYNNPSLEAPPLFSLTWPTMADVLEANGFPWKCYSVADGSLPTPVGAFNPLIFFASMLASPSKLGKALTGIDQFFLDLAAGTLPAVSWIITEPLVSEHPPAPPDMGQLLAARVTRALLESSAWDSSALFITYDEGGGYFDHVPPHVVERVPAGVPHAGEAVGPGFRVPLTIVSPYARPNTVYSAQLDHTSILQFIERTFALPQTLPIHPGRRRVLDNLAGAFDFSRTVVRPALPSPQDLYALANETVLTTDVQRGVVECSTTIPTWLPPLLGVAPVTPYPTPTPIA